MESGDVWVGITVRARSLESLQTFNPIRYRLLHYRNPRPKNQRGKVIFDYDPTDADTENGLIWDAYSQTGVLLRGMDPRSPLFGYDVKAIMGCAATGGDLSAYTAAVHPISCQENGDPIYDGFLIFMTGAPGSLNSEEDKLSPLDNRCKIYSEVPLIRIYTTDDLLGTGHHPDWACMQRRPDSDSANAPYRSYELSGTGRMNTYQERFAPCEADVLKAGRQHRKTRGGSPDTMMEYPLRYALCAAYDNLKKWVRNGILPPRGQPLEIQGTYPDVFFRLNAFQIPEGGIRLPMICVPLGSYPPGTIDAKPLKFDAATLRMLYPTKQDYLEKLIRETLKSLQARWILPQHAMELIMEAAAVSFPE